MKIFYLIIIGCSIANSSKGQTVTEIAKKTLTATTALHMLDKSSQVKSMGSGVILSDGLVLTNFHVIDGANSGYVKLNHGSRKLVILGYTAVDKENDLAILKVAGVDSTGIKISVTKPQVGDQIYVAGNPNGLQGTFSNGIVSSLRTIKGQDLVQITAPISPGSSGGPVVNAVGDIIGIAVGAYTDGQNLNFAVPADKIRILIDNQHAVKPISEFYKNSIASLNKNSYDKQGVQIRNIVWGDDEYGGEYSYTQLREFSVKNNTQQTIGTVHLMLLVYDETKTLVDFSEGFFNDDLSFDFTRTPPNMAKTHRAISSGKAGYDIQEAKTHDVSGPHFRMKKGYHYELRLLDYQILGD